MFENLTDKLERSFKILKGEGRITEINVAETLKEIRRALIDADVNYKVAKTFTDEVKQKALGQDVLKAVKPGQMMTKIVRDELAELMGGTATDIRLEGTPAVILIAGLQGSGKTTFSGKLAAMLNFCGSDISVWDAAAKNGLSGVNVRQRPGYAQIGFVETQTVAQGFYTNSVGSLLTPAFGASGTLRVSFDAMAYKNTSVHANSGAKDMGGDLKSVIVEVIGGGTIDGATKKVVSGLATDAFNTYSLTIDGATASTALRFTSEPASGEFSRWFIDDICVTK